MYMSLSPFQTLSKFFKNLYFLCFCFDPTVVITIDRLTFYVVSAVFQSYSSGCKVGTAFIRSTNHMYQYIILGIKLGDWN